MTPLPKESGFSKQHRLRGTYALRAASQPLGEDVQGGVLVSVGGEAARFARIRPVSERHLLVRDRAETTAHLRRVCRVHRFESDTGTLSLVFEDRKEGAPAHVVRALRKPRAGDALDIEVFGVNRSIPGYESVRRLEVKVSSLVGNVPMQVRYVSTRLAPTIRTLRPTGGNAL